MLSVTAGTAGTIGAGIGQAGGQMVNGLASITIIIDFGFAQLWELLIKSHCDEHGTNEERPQAVSARNRFVVPVISNGRNRLRCWADQLHADRKVGPARSNLGTTGLCNQRPGLCGWAKSYGDC